MSSTRKRRVVPVGARVIGRLLLAGLFVCIALTLHRSEAQAVEALEDRFRVRVEAAVPFLQAYVRDLLRRERLVAEKELAAASVSASDFERVVRAFGFEAGVLIDERGFLLSVFPERPELLGSYIVDRYTHLSQALVGGASVSSVVLSAAARSPVAAFAARYSAHPGARVFSGAYDVTKVPLHAYMVHALAIPGASADLIDDHGAVVASNRDPSSLRAELAAMDPQLTAAIRDQDHGVFRGDRGDRLFVAHTIEDTPWRLVATVDQRTLYAPLAGEARWPYWMMYAAFCVAAFFACELLLKLVDNSAKLRAMNDDLARLARMDRLTGLPNRLHLEEQLARLTSTARRRHQALSAMVIDVDYFKSVNDSYGHAAGDEVLRTLAVRMASALRAEDMLGRWGGEEFLALLPNTEVEGARVVAERLRTAASAEPVTMSDGLSVRVTVSIGCATAIGPFDEGVVNRADQAVYSAKTLGRDRVVTSEPPPMSCADEGHVAAT